MSTVPDLLENALKTIDTMLADFSHTSIASTSQVNDGLLDLRLTIVQVQNLRDQEIDFALDNVAEATPSIV